MLNRRALLRRAGPLLALLVLLAACGGAETAEPSPGDAPEPSGEPDAVDVAPEEVPAGSEPAAAPLDVVVTTSILGDVVGTLAGDAAEVTVLLPPGTDPHGFQPSAADAAALRGADLVIANGLMLEESLLDVIHAAAEEGIRVLEVAEHLDPIEFDWEGPDVHDGDDDAHADEDVDSHDDEDMHGSEDPHVWFDPVRMVDAVRLIASELAAVDTSFDADEWDDRADAYADDLLAVHEYLEERFATIPEENRVLVTNHDALGYLAHRYGFDVLGTVIPGSSTQAEADPGQFAELIHAVEDAQVPAVFAENTDSTTLAEQLASEVVGRTDLQVEVVRLYTDALGEPGSGAETYLGLLRTNAELITDALR